MVKNAKLKMYLNIATKNKVIVAFLWFPVIFSSNDSQEECVHSDLGIT